jgi:sigma-B regulation protein RsbU (phosphoserine phosphatase)
LEKIDTLLDSAPCGYLSFTDDGIIQRVNTTLCNLIGYSKEELQGKKLEILQGIAGKIFMQTHLFPLLKLHNKADEIFLSFVSKNKETIPVLLNAERKVEGDIKLNNCIIIPIIHRRKYEDEILLARKLAEEKLNENKELIKARLDIDLHAQELDKHVNSIKQLNLDFLQFNQIINHDMQECIRKIIIFTKMITGEPNNANKERVLIAANKLKAINKSLDLFISLGANKEDLVNVDLNIIIKKALQDAVAETGTQVDFQAATLPQINGFPLQLQTLFFQLFSNSIKFKRNENVSIKIEQTIYKENLYQNNKDKYKYQDVVKITITDDGLGFNNEFKDYVFTMFKRMESNANSGMGFGLSLCKKIVESHNGNISITSESEKGTIITLILPI